jgi:hypothetical protein
MLDKIAEHIKRFWGKVGPNFAMPQALIYSINPE